MAIALNNPLSDLRSMQEQMSRLLESAWRLDDAGGSERGVWQPPVDIYEDETEVSIVVELPGLDQQDISLKVENNTLEISGERRQDDNLQRKTLYRRIERCYGRFSRAFSLPESIDHACIVASFERGLLRVVLQKNGRVLSQQIPIDLKE